MQTTILGRTNLTVSRMGLGAGGHSRIGRNAGLTDAQSADLVRRALDHGVNFIDTAEGYGTESVIGQALQGRDRTTVVLSTKKSTRHEQVTPDALQTSLDQSLKHLRTDYIDLYNLHGVVPQDYAYLVNDIYPALQKAQQQGKIRFVGLSEMFNEDFEHTMLQQALADDLWDVLMVGFNLLNQTARANVFAQAIAQNVGIQIMFAVRKALSHPDNLRAFTDALVEKGQIDLADLRLSSGRSLDAFPDFLLAEAPSLPDAAYRFCRDEPGVHVVLSGTGNAAHLDANLASFTRPPLTQETRDRLIHIFRRVNSTTGQEV
ncbi:MAG: aldo/keto reductase [Gemmatimonadetes bacterium]|nr:aldo/keto reductase [Gemmatimonadota bacterium]MYI62947.1 aldo/keto reductase [Gemmatimonadota bacterium]